MLRSSLALPALLLATAAAAATPPSPPEIVASAPAGEWRAIADDDVLIMTLANGGQVVIQLAPGFSPEHVARIRALARARWWDATAIYRVQDNYVVQWGDRTERKPLPAGITDAGPAEYDRAPVGTLTPLTKPDPYAPEVGYTANGWAVGRGDGREWLTHCYAMVGVGRDLAPSIGSGAELYAVIGPARVLDRNIAVVGRVIEGMDRLSSLPRGTGKLGFYADDQQPTPIVSVRLASMLPIGERPRFEYLSPAAATFRRYVRAKENREPPFFTKPAGGADICGVPVPVRRVPG